MNEIVNENNESETLRLSFESLSPRHIELLRLARQNLSCDQLAEVMGVSVATIHSHRKHILKALRLRGKRGFWQAVRLLERYESP